MMTLLTKWLLAALTLLVIAEIIPGVTVETVYSAIIAALVLGFLNAVAKPVLVVLTLPITLITLGLFVFVINALLFMFAASFLEGFDVAGFLPALVGSLILTVVSSLSNKFI